MKDFNYVLKELINLELNISELYTIFYNSIKEDKAFWWQLLNEEKNHASLLISSRSFMNILKEDFFEQIDLNCIENENKKIVELIEKYRKAPPARVDALKTAVILENSAGEMHYQNLMKKEPEGKIEKILQELNKDDVDHARRIQNQLDRIMNL